MQEKEKIKIRHIKPEEKSELIELIKELAEFEKLDPPDKSAQIRLLKEVFRLNPSLYVLVAIEGKKIIGYAIYFFTFSSFKGLKTLYLEDIYVTEEYRRYGVGQKFFKRLLNIAKFNKCGRMEWAVLNWNKNAIKFYKKLGAKPLDEWTYYRMDL
ncbi:MAG: GNAT family N-acetyltransferase [Ignavibacteria bacterium]|nr:GNAT family N-acetyltransferase [Ignavibacteria bacterium]